MLHSAAISWRSNSQEIVAMSTAEVELIAASCAAQEALYLCTMFSDLGYEQTEPTTIFKDNAACIAMSKNPVQRDKCKHFNSSDNFLCNNVQHRHVVLVSKGTKEMTADVLTKALVYLDHDCHVCHAMGVGNLPS
eukprot:3685667-Rhodomonas_salina.1